MPKVVHFEIPADDVTRAREFYGGVFGWQLREMQEMDYTLVETVPVDQKTQLPLEPGATNGGLMKRTAETPAPVLTVDVESIDISLKEIEAAGGNRPGPGPRSPGWGLRHFKDSEGNVVGLWETQPAG